MSRNGALLVLLLFTLVPAQMAAQQPGTATTGRTTSGFSLEQNYPNPFNPETTIPFSLGADLFAEGGSAVVSIRIYNMLQQFVAAPTALRHPAGEGAAVLDLAYATPGRHEAYWDGLDQNGRQVASGVYFVQLTVNGQSRYRRMFVTK